MNFNQFLGKNRQTTGNFSLQITQPIKLTIDKKRKNRKNFNFGISFNDSSMYNYSIIWQLFLIKISINAMFANFMLVVFNILYREIPLKIKHSRKYDLQWRNSGNITVIVVHYVDTYAASSSSLFLSSAAFFISIALCSIDCLLASHWS